MVNSEIQNKGLSKSSDLLLPIIDMLKEAEDPMVNIEIIEGSGPDEKTILLKSTIDLLSNYRAVHVISISAYLLREILNRFAKEESKKSDPKADYECRLYDHNCFPQTELNKILKVTNSKFRFESPDKLIWNGEMSDAERDDLLSYSNHPFWKDAVYTVYNAKKAKKTEQAIRDERIRNFLNKQKSKFTLPLSEFPKLTQQINDLIMASNRLVHDTRKYRPVGEALVQNNSVMPVEVKQEFTEFSELIAEFGKLMENFKLKPIGKLNQLDEIISE